ncbi:hypothetical protein N7493_004053 [Penicillium malachiteum]|uniref:BZIP domain-containing protein n=1 Tax=Penicillium malachiteum TaxID=1324776 RepID=A0AAD6HQU2_9EURO|nr:hypothetical protein N7493_004053 [Penicillium malachiteum]
MSSVAKEKKRAADREAQRFNRARNKAYITQLEQTTQDLTGPNPPEKPRCIAQDRNLGPECSQRISPVFRFKSPSVTFQVQQQHATFFGNDLTCSDRERNYLAVLGSAMTLIQDCFIALSGSMMLIPKLHDDNFCIRAVIDGWKVTMDRFGADVIWELIQAIDEGLYYRADPVTRIALLQIIRSLCWPELRDQWIVEGTEFANELCAASFSTRIRFQWPFEVRDVFHKHVLTDTLVFSSEFENRYHELASWQLDTEVA